MPLSRNTSPSPAVGWVKIPPCSAVYGMRAIIATWTAIMSSLASTPKAVKPRISSLSAAMSIFGQPSVHKCSRFEQLTSQTFICTCICKMRDE